MWKANRRTTGDKKKFTWTFSFEKKLKKWGVNTDRRRTSGGQKSTLEHSSQFLRKKLKMWRVNRWMTHNRLSNKVHFEHSAQFLRKKLKMWRVNRWKTHNRLSNKVHLNIQLSSWEQNKLWLCQEDYKQRKGIFYSS